MADLKSVDCDCEYPCSCVDFEGIRYRGLESIIDALVEERDNLLSYVAVLERDNPSELL